MMMTVTSVSCMDIFVAVFGGCVVMSMCLGGCGCGAKVWDLYQRSRLPIWKVRAEVAQASRVV